MNIERLKKLVDIFSVSSYEEELKKFFITNIQTTSIITDKLGSVFYLKKSTNKDAKRLLVTCSMDEVGLMVKEVNKDTTLDFICLEALSPASLLHQRVKVLTRDNNLLEGLIINKKVKFNEVALDRVSIDDLCIDLIDKDSYKEVRPGDICGFKNDFININNRIVSKGLNQKIFIEIILSLIEKTRDLDLDYDLALGIIAQSTIGFRGTKTANYVVKPDMALALTGFEVNNSNPPIRLDDGLILGQFDKQMLPNKDLLEDVYNKLGGKKYFGLIGNDGSFIHKTLNGVVCISMGIPIKNIHTSIENLSLDDANILEEKILNYIGSLKNQDFYRLGVSDDEF